MLGMAEYFKRMLLPERLSEQSQKLDQLLVLLRSHLARLDAIEARLNAMESNIELNAESSEK